MKDLIGHKFLVHLKLTLTYYLQYYSLKDSHFFIINLGYIFDQVVLIKTWRFQAEKNVVYTFLDQLPIVLTIKKFPQAKVMKVSYLLAPWETFSIKWWRKIMFL